MTTASPVLAEATAFVLALASAQPVFAQATTLAFVGASAFTSAKNPLPMLFTEDVGLG